LGETAKVLLDGLGIGVNVKFMPYQFPRNSWHVSGLPCKDVPILLEEFDKCEFLFGIQIVSYVNNLGGVTREQLDGAELVLQLDGQLLLWFMIKNLYEGGRDIERTMVTQKT
jgi:hypothetical protein